MKKILLIITLLITIFLIGCLPEPDNNVPRESQPPRVAIVGQAVFNSPNQEQLAAGLQLTGKDTLILFEKFNSIRAEEFFESVLPRTTYIYSYNERAYYFPPGSVYYSKTTLERLQTGHRYYIVTTLSSGGDAAVLQYPYIPPVQPPEPKDEEPEIIWLSCQDSDGGINVDERGTLTARRTIDGVEETIEITDSCLLDEGLVNEYFCDGRARTAVARRCGNGCAQGACLEPVDPEITLKLTFDGANPLEDVSLGRNIVTAEGATPTQQGYRGAGYYFNGDSSIVLTQQPISNLVGEQFTIYFWYNPGDLRDRPSFGFTQSGRLNNDNPLASYDNGLNFGNGALSQVVGNNVLPEAQANTWGFYTLVSDSENYIVYYNGVEVRRENVRVAPFSDRERSLAIGESGFEERYASRMVGTLDEFTILSTAISDAEVIQLYNS